MTDTLLQVRIEQVSAKLLGKVYRPSPLGEGSGLDSDPLIRFDAFDCTTFVETVGALSLSGAVSTTEALKVMNEIRYSDGRPAFEKRNHFVSLDWIPNNIRKGLLEDLTQNLYPREFYTIHTVIDKATWFEKNFNIKTSMPVTEAALDVVSVEDLINHEDLLARIPSGVVVSFAVANPALKEKIGTALDITHQGILVRVENQLILRHARGVSYGVVEEPFLPYIKKATEWGLYAVNFTRFVRRK